MSSSDIVLYDSSLGLSGKPDYIVRQKHKYIPIELKSGKSPRMPYESHILQLAAYCYLIEKEYGKRPPYGIIQYQDKKFAIDYTSGLEFRLMETITKMREMNLSQDVPRSHQESSRCNGCGFRQDCDQRI